MKENTRTILVSNIAVFIITLLSVLVTIGELPNIYIYMGICYSLIGLCLVFLSVIYIRQFSQSFRNDLLELKKREGIEESVPAVITMEKRIDKFCIKKDTSGIVDLHFEIKTVLEEPVREIPFPVYAEIKEDTYINSPVKLLSLMVDGKKKSINDRYHPQEVRYPLGKKKDTTPVMEYGLLMVPAGLQKGISECTIDIRLELKGSFPNMHKQEFAIIEVPYITKYLEVVVEGEDGLSIRGIPSPGQTVIAMPSNIDFKDQHESYQQDRNWRILDDKIIWACKYPKIGYSYVIWFEAESKSGVSD